MELNEEKLREEVKRKKKDGWIDAWFAIEALAVKEDVVKGSLETHIKKLTNARDVLVYETVFSEINRVEKPVRDVEEGYAQIVEVKLFMKDLLTMVKVIMLYGPSSIEILGPNDMKIKISETQDIANTIATLVHQFASAGVGGVVITPEK